MARLALEGLDMEFEEFVMPIVRLYVWICILMLFILPLFGMTVAAAWMYMLATEALGRGAGGARRRRRSSRGMQRG